MSEFLVVTGMSGAGRSSAADVLEDLGWLVIDNLPAALIPRVAELADQPGSVKQRVALVVGRSGEEAIAEIEPALAALKGRAARVRVLFLDAPEDVLVRRFEGTRRRHPFAGLGVAEAIGRERELLTPLRAGADFVIDTGGLNVHELRGRLMELVGTEHGAGLEARVVSFGYAYGLPLDVDMVFDVRFLPNPHWDASLRPRTGLDEGVRDFVLGNEETQAFLAKVDDLLGVVLPGFEREGKSYVAIAVGCTGGRHRSVVIAEEVARRMAATGVTPTVRHRDIDR